MSRGLSIPDAAGSSPAAPATCEAELHIPDDYDRATGANTGSHATIVCQREKGHEGQHVTIYLRGSTKPGLCVTMTWEGDDRE